MLHISCHGLNIKSNTKTIGYDADAMENENFLLFETPTGEGQLISTKHLNKIIKQSLPSLDIIFLAACDSEKVGKIFLKSGARHVICVQNKKEVLDQAAIDFTATFYRQIFSKK